MFRAIVASSLFASFLIGCGGDEDPPAAIGGSSTATTSPAASPAPAAPSASTASHRPNTPAALPASPPEITISRETTFVTEPRAADGSIDLVGALNARFGEGIAAEENAAVLLYEALGPAPEGSKLPDRFFERLGVPVPQEAGDYFLDLRAYMSESEGIDRNDPLVEGAVDEQTRATVEPWRHEDLLRIAGWLQANENPLQVVARASARPRYFSPVVIPGDVFAENPGAAERGLLAQLLPGPQTSREVARALLARAMLRVGEGRAEEAWNDLLVLHRLGRLLGQGPTLIEGLVGMSIHALASAGSLSLLMHAELDSDMLARIARDLQELPPLPETAEKVDWAERLTFIDAALFLADGGPATESYDEALGEIAKLLNQPWFPAVSWDAALREGNGWYDRAVDALRVTGFAERALALRKLDQELKELQSRFGDRERIQRAIATGTTKTEAGTMLGELMVALLLPAAGTVRASEDRAIQRQENLHAAVALARYRADHGRFPESLNALVPVYLPQVPTDHFTGVSLVYQPRRESYVLYSLGPNQRDDGGLSERDGPDTDDHAVRMEPGHIPQQP